REPASALPQHAGETALPRRGDSAATAPDATDARLPQRDPGIGLPRRAPQGALPQPETVRPGAGGDGLPQRGTGGATGEVAPPSGGGLPTRDPGTALPRREAGAGDGLPRRDPGHAAPPSDAQLGVTRSAGRHTGDTQVTADLPTGEQGGSADPAASPAGADPAGPAAGAVPGREAWQGELDRLAAETAYVDTGTDAPGADSGQAGSGAADGWADQPAPLVEPARLSPRGDQPSGVTVRNEAAGITPRQTPVQNPFGPPTSALTAEGGQGVDTPFDLTPPTARPQVSVPETAEAPSGTRPTAEDDAHDKLQAMLDELKRNPAGPFGRPLNTPPDSGR